MISGNLLNELAEAITKITKIWSGRGTVVDKQGHLHWFGSSLHPEHFTEDAVLTHNKVANCEVNDWVVVFVLYADLHVLFLRLGRFGKHRDGEANGEHGTYNDKTKH